MSNSFDDNANFNAETSQFLRIPLKRIGAVIGVKGANKEAIEAATKTNIMIDSDTGEVEIRPNDELKDPVQLFNARDIVKAIGRGFTHEQAIKIAEDPYYLEIIRLKPIIGDKPNHLHRVRARLIGTKGRTRKSLEELTKTSIVISGSTVSMIGTFEHISRAREAILDIINGAKIESVIGKLEEERNRTRKEEQSLWEADEEFDINDLGKEEEIEDPFANYEEED